MTTDRRIVIIESMISTEDEYLVRLGDLKDFGDGPLINSDTYLSKEKPKFLFGQLHLLMKEAYEFQEKLSTILKPREVGMDITTAQLTEIFHDFMNGLFKRYKTFFLHQEIAKEEMYIIFNRFSTLKKKVELKAKELDLIIDDMFSIPYTRITKYVIYLKTFLRLTKFNEPGKKVLNDIIQFLQKEVQSIQKEESLKLVKEKEKISPIDQSVAANLAKGAVIMNRYILGDVVEKRDTFVLRNSTISESKDQRNLAVKFQHRRDHFLREVRALVQLQHTNIVRMVSAFEADPTEQWFPAALCVVEPGESSLVQLDNTADFNESRFRVMLLSITDALSFCFSTKIVHCDIRPDSISYYPQERQWKLTNFDFSSKVEENVLYHTADYMAPEVAKSLRMKTFTKASFAIDLFGLGRLLQWYFAGGVSFFPEYQNFIIMEEAEKLVYLADDKKVVDSNDILDPELKNLICGLLDKKPEKRLSLEHVISYASGKKLNLTRNENSSIFERQTLGDGQYQLIGKLGSGGFGQVYEVINTDTGATLALKFYEDEEPFDQEVKILKLVKHRNVIKMEEYFEKDKSADWYPFSVTAMEKGLCSLLQYARLRPFELARTKLIVGDIISGLEACHEKKIVHCDLKPANVMMFRDTILGLETWKLIDFDSACSVGEEVSRGTTDFCAPEVLVAAGTDKKALADTKIDMFSVGRILQWFLSGEGFWPGNDMATDEEKIEILKQPVEIEVPRIDNAPARNAIIGLLRKNPKERIELKKLKGSSFIQMNMDTKAVSK